LAFIGITKAHKKCVGKSNNESNLQSCTNKTFVLFNHILFSLESLTVKRNTTSVIIIHVHNTYLCVTLTLSARKCHIIKIYLKMT